MQTTPEALLPSWRLSDAGTHIYTIQVLRRVGNEIQHHWLCITNNCKQAELVTTFKCKLKSELFYLAYREQSSA